MGQHSAAGASLRRAHRAAWAVFLGMAGTSMAFNVYHAVRTGQMPVPLAWSYGVVPLAISVGVLEFASKSPSRVLRAGSYLVTVGAMYMSAFATGAVTEHAAPPHAQLLFGLLLDGAALLAIRFILAGPRAADAEAAATAREDALRAQAAAERAAREHAETAMRDGLRSLREAQAATVMELKAQLDRESAAREEAQREAAAVPAAEAAKADAETAAETARQGLETAERARSEAEQRAAAAEARAAKLDRKLAAAGGGKKPQGSRKSAPAAVPDDFDARAEALAILDREPGISGRELGERVRMSERWGQEFKRRLASASPQPEAPGD